MTDTQTMRQWLNDNGRTQPKRGPISESDRKFYEDSQASVFSEPSELEGGVSDADFSSLDEEPSVPLQPERAPRVPKPKSVRQTGLKLLRGGQEGGAKPKGKPQRKHARVSLERLTGKVWERLGRMMENVAPATGKCIGIQAPIAGMLLEDTFKNTLIDKPLQPIARAEERFEKLGALLIPPLCVFALEHAATLPPREQAIRSALIMPMLDEGLSLWIEVAGDKVEEAAQRRADFAAKRAEIERIKAAIFGIVATTTAEPAA